MPLLFHGNTSVEGEIPIKEGHDVGNGCAALDANSGSSLVESQTDYSLPSVAISTPEEQTLMTRAAIATQQTHNVSPSPPSSYDGHHGSLNPSTSLQPRTTAQEYPAQEPRSLRRRSPRPFRRSLLPEDVMSQGAEPNAAWKEQVRKNRLALNALCEARQQAEEANTLPNNDGNNGTDLSHFHARYQEYLGRRGLSNINEFTRHIESVFEL